MTMVSPDSSYSVGQGPAPTHLQGPGLPQQHRGVTIHPVTHHASTPNLDSSSHSISSPGQKEPELHIEFDGTTVLCRVCGDKASGFHYGVHSCEGCKGFFRRSIQQKIQYRPCTKNQQCSILRINRNRCQYCRLKKCIAVGMSRDAVRFGRVPKREKARILAAMQQSSSSRAHAHSHAASAELDDEPRLIARVVRAHVETCEFTRDRVAAMRARARDCPSYSMPTLACPLNPAPELQSEKEFSQRFAHVIRGVIDFAGLIPGFQLLTQDDKFTLLKSGLFDALFVRLICMFDAPVNTIICLNGQVMKRDSIQNGANARFLVDSTFKFAERMNSMCLTDAEIALFCAIVLITPDRPGLRNVQLVERMHNKLKSCLQSVINQNRPNRPDFLHDLMNTLPDLRTLSTLHTEKLVVFRTEHKELLRQQMWSEEDISKSPAGGMSWCSSEAAMDDAVKSPLGSVSSTESGDMTSMAEHYIPSLAGSAPLLAATLAGGTCPMRHRANSGGSHGSVSSAEDEVSAASHLAQNGLTITPVARQSVHTHMRYRKLDSPTDSGIESGNEKHEKQNSGSSSSCSSPRSSLEDHAEDKQHRHIVEDMPVLKRVLQAPPLYDTNSLMDEAYKPHKKFRAMRQKDTAEAEPAMPVMTRVPVQSQLQMHLTRPQQASTLSSTHSVLAKSLMEGPRMTPEQMKRTDIIQNYIRRGDVHHTAVPSSISVGEPSVCPLRNTPPPASASPVARWASRPPFAGASVITAARSPAYPAPEPGPACRPPYAQSPHSTSPGPAPVLSPLPPPRSAPLVELQVDIADSQQPLNLSKKSPTPPPPRPAASYLARNVLMEA